MIVDDDSIEEIAIGMKKIEEKVWEQSGKKFQIWKLWVVNPISVMIMLYICSVNDALNHN